MGDQNEDHLGDGFRQETDADGRDRAALDEIFKSGARARRHGTPSCDNPYAPGSEERQEWSAGWEATVEPDDRGAEPNSGYQRN